MTPRSYSEALSAQKAAKERKEKRMEKKEWLTPKNIFNPEATSSSKRIVARMRRDAMKSIFTMPKKKAKKKKSPSRSKLEKEAWDAFSLYIRERDKDNGCISCGGPVEQAGHMISRRRRATKYDEVNVNGQCAKCNWADKFVPGAHDKHVIAFVQRYSQLAYTSLVEHSWETVQHGKADMIALRDTYREKLLTLKSSRAQQSEDDRMQR